MGHYADFHVGLPRVEKTLKCFDVFANRNPIFWLYAEMSTIDWAFIKLISLQDTKTGSAETSSCVKDILILAIGQKERGDGGPSKHL